MFWILLLFWKDLLCVHWSIERVSRRFIQEGPQIQPRIRFTYKGAHIVCSSVLKGLNHNMEPSQRRLPKSRVLRGVLHFTPSWFSVTMGTGIMSILLHTSPHTFRGEHVIGTVLYVVNILLFVLFSLVTVARYIVFPWAFALMLRHPSQSLFLGTIPMGLATIVNATVIILVPKYGRRAIDASWALWWVDVALTVLSVFGIPLVMFQLHTLTLNTMTAAWLLPIVPAVVCAASGGLVASVLTLPQAQITIFLSYVLWGIGMTLSVVVMTLYFHRLAVYSLPNAEVIVSAFLPLGPCGQGTFGLLQLAKVGRSVFNQSNFAGVQGAGDVVLVASVVIGFMLWGLGLWWLVHGVSCVLLRAYSSKLKLNMGWWGFVFPLGVFVAGTAALGQLVASAFFSILSVVLLGVLAVLYVVVAFGTAQGAFNRTLLVAPCMTDLEGSSAVAPCMTESERSSPIAESLPQQYPHRPADVRCTGCTDMHQTMCFVQIIAADL